MYLSEVSGGFPKWGYPQNHLFQMVVASKKHIKAINRPFWENPIYGNLHVSPQDIYPLVNVYIAIEAMAQSKVR